MDANPPCLDEPLSTNSTISQQLNQSTSLFNLIDQYNDYTGVYMTYLTNASHY